ncbi:helix-turn-helix domain-containing protein [Plantactinospora sp. CA-290183]|uniref:helix-turn-helix domain-containing protein n=1 Tax=Plantactinospora sp. CA-290183 TaxID=3240006 RepID=UPI003D905547
MEKARPSLVEDEEPDPEVQAIASLYGAVKSVEAVARAIGRSYPYVRRRLTNAGVAVPAKGGRPLKQRRTHPPDKEIIDRYTVKLHSLARIADDLRVSAAYVINRLEKAGIARRPRGWQPSKRHQPRPMPAEPLTEEGTAPP